MEKETVFLTGTTGLLGSYLLKIMLQKGHKVYCLARNKDNKGAKKRIEDVLNFWDKKVLEKNKGNLIVIEGDITKKNLGLTKKNIELLKKEINEIFHCAAVTKFNWPLNKIRKVNVGGTKNVLDFALKCKQLKKVNHISTVYVCGDYKGVFKESDLDVGQKFDNTYSQSKFEAEKVVKKYRRKKLWVDIFRFPIIIGESTTGKINKFKNIYQFMHLYSLDILNFIPLENSYIDMVPVDYVSKAMYVVSKNTRIKNKTYHVLLLKPISLRRFIKLVSKIMGIKMPQIISFNDLEWRLITPVQMRLLQKTIFYINFKVKLRSHYTNSVLRSYDSKLSTAGIKLFSRIVIYFNENNSIKHGS